MIRELLERELRTSPCGPALQAFAYSVEWCEVLRGFMQRRGLNNEEVVAIGAGEQLFLCDTSPEALLGELHDVPLPDEFPLRLYRAAVTEPRTAPSPSPCPGSDGAEGAPTSL